ncbi:hypothetical protein KIH86_26625 [Paenibacillus sp. HN-1]|uniref:hypothetical protein n=1 Tax=Paenibacillus TaxID=44249 RepID=UPI001CA8C32D|nr:MULTISPECIES: hypothetical protein [Paenibacillus]MBY9080159.1 hypothetical protein [Paenibacillus sp. CGMCC 1.18879]MBY9087767.1 hypothetical protein [Paenibacillus sinensis]
MQKRPYSEIEPQLRTGDLILFSGQYEISKLVEKLEGSLWSHVAMVVRIPEIETPLLWESTALTNLPDALMHDHLTGPKLVDLRQRLETYGSDVVPYVPPRYAVRPLEVERTEEMISSLHELFTKLHGIPNPGQWKMILEVIEGRFFHIRSKLDNYTCSELIAESFIEMGLLDPKAVINGFMPSDFSSDGHLKLIKGQFGDEIEIDLTESLSRN